MSCVIFGAGKIARGFVGHLLYLSGIDFVFVEKVDSLAKLPSREVLLATVCSVFNAPIAAFARGVQAIVDKQNGGDTAEAAAE